MIALAIGLLARDYVQFLSVAAPGHRDASQVWFASRALLAGHNPYELVGHGLQFEWGWPFYYPLTAAVAWLPLAFLSEQSAVAFIAGLGCAALAWTLMEHGYAPLLAFLSMSVWQAVKPVQWSPLMAAAAGLAPLSLILATKPTIGFAVFAARPNWWAACGAIGLFAIASIIQPHWIADWRHALASTNVAPNYRFRFLAPIALPGGICSLAVLTRWRRPEARLLVALACVPHTTLPYETVLLLLVPRGWIEVAALVVLSHVALWWAEQSVPPDMAAMTLAYGQSAVAFMYLPCALMILRRPNEGTAPVWLERLTKGWPSWLRGEAPGT